MPRPALPVDTSTFVGQVSAEIRRRRLKKYATADEAARAAGVPEKTWYRWESGKVPLWALPICAQALGCSTRTLIPS